MQENKDPAANVSVPHRRPAKQRGGKGAQAAKRTAAAAARDARLATVEALLIFGMLEACEVRPAAASG
jgi:hypothetical protein